MLDDNLGRLKKTPLYEEHKRLGARMADFAGWYMPIQYEHGILSEYRQVREKAGIFDISHMGEFVVDGEFVSSGLDRIVTMRLDNLQPKRGRYGMILNEAGGIIDDLIVFRIEKEKWFIVVNAANIEKDAIHFRANLSSDSIFTDVSADIGKLDVQGPLSRQILTNFIDEIDKLDYYTFDYFELLGEKALVSRTGYTGELGYEIYFPAHRLVELWQMLLSDDRLKPAGLGARDLLRIEMGYSLYGHELTEDISPIEAGLERFVWFEKDFIGKESLLTKKAKGVDRTLTGIISDTRRSPREGNRILSEGGEEIGLVTSGGFSPALNKGIGLGFIKKAYSSLGDHIYFCNGQGKKSPAVISERIFFRSGSLKD